MTCYFRLLLIIIKALFGPKLKFGEESRITLRTYPNDIDFAFHMNNGRYLTLMDIGRMDLTIRQGFLRPMIRNKWLPVLGGAKIKYIRSLKPFQKFELVTNLIGWDEKWVYIEQKFMAENKLYAVAMVKALFKTKSGLLSTQELFTGIGAIWEAPHIPHSVIKWIEDDQPEKLLNL